MACTPQGRIQALQFGRHCVAGVGGGSQRLGLPLVRLGLLAQPAGL